MAVGLFGSLLMLLTACGSGDSASGTSTTSSSYVAPTRYPQFNPTIDLIPYPNDALFEGSDDGTLNAPYDPGASVTKLVIPINTLDGFSTVAPLNASFSTAVQESSLVADDTVRVYEVALDGIGGKVSQVTRRLAPGEYNVGLDNNADSSARGLVVTPTRPLSPKTSYLVVLTDGITDPAGLAFEPSTHYALTKYDTALVNAQGISQVKGVSDSDAVKLEPIRQRNQAAEIAASVFDATLQRSRIILSWSFTTQSVDDVLQRVKAEVDNAPPPVTKLKFFPDRDTPRGQALIYQGTITLPYYLAVPTAEDPSAPRHGYWRGVGGSNLTAKNPMPALTAIHDIPLVLTIPKSAKPAGGWPVIIFQHGNTSNRAALMAFADRIAEAGFAAVAIDMPMHGITGSETDGSELLRQPGLERTFDLDQIKNPPSTSGPPVPLDTTAPPDPDATKPDGKIDASGSFFIKLEEILTTRDNIRQGVADLLSLRRSLDLLDYDGGGPDLDVSRVQFIGHSLGATVGVVYLGIETRVGASVLGMPGGGIAKQLDGSASSGPSIAFGLSTNSLIKGTPDYERFLAATQIVLDSCDPINYAKAAVRSRALKVIEVVGDANATPARLPDQIVPNSVLNLPGTVPSPTGGTDPLLREMGLSLATTSTSGDMLRVVVRFSAGHHSSLISSFDDQGRVDTLSAATQAEMQSQSIGFVASNGKQLTIANPSVVSTMALKPMSGP